MSSRRRIAENPFEIQWKDESFLYFLAENLLELPCIDIFPRDGLKGVTNQQKDVIDFLRKVIIETLRSMTNGPRVKKSCAGFFHNPIGFGIFGDDSSIRLCSSSWQQRDSSFSS
jgi:hypothetical protein